MRSRFHAPQAQPRCILGKSRCKKSGAPTLILRLSNVKVAVGVFTSVESVCLTVVVPSPIVSMEQVALSTPTHINTMSLCRRDSSAKHKGAPPFERV